LKGQDLLKQRFLAFAETECKRSSELYYRLSIQIANDPQLLNIAVSTRDGQPAPNIFFAAVHYLLLKAPDQPLAEYYPSIHGSRCTEIPFNLFKTFCLTNENKIKKVISTKIVQTNVISRCAYLMPIFSKIIAEEDRRAVIIDIGTSAGLTLNFNKYEYWYNGQKVFGNSYVHVKSTILKSAIPLIYPISQPLYKIGIDQNLIDPTDKDDVMWLKALVWTDQLERFVAMEEALKLDDLKNIRFVQAATVVDFELEIVEQTYVLL
jgi:hypothetical protein